MTLSATVNEYTRSKIQNPVLVYDESGDNMAVQYDLFEKNCTVWSSIMDENIPTMFDTGATASFIDESHELVRKLPLKQLDQPRQLLMFDGRPSASGYIKHFLEVDIQFHPNYPSRKTTLLVTRLSGADIVLGTSFLSEHGVSLDFGRGTIRFPMVSVSSTGRSKEDLRGSKMKQQRGLRPPTTGPNSIVIDHPRYYYVPREVATINDDRRLDTPDSPVLSTTDGSACDIPLIHSEEETIPALLSDNSDDGSDPDVIIQDPANYHDPRLSVTVSEEPEPGTQDDLDIGRQYPIIPKDTVLDGDLDCADPYDSDYEYLYGPRDEGRKPTSIIQDYINGCTLHLAAVQDDRLPTNPSGLEDEALEETEDSEILRVVPSEYHEFMTVFRKKEGADTLPPHRPYDHRIILKDGARLKVAPLYQMDSERIKFMREHIEKERRSGKIRPSSSPFGSPCFLVSKSDGGWRLVVDYRGLNLDTVKDAYPLPLISQIFGSLGNSRYYAKFDLTAAYQRVRMAEGEEKLTAFRTPLGMFESLVMRDGLCNAPATFQHFLNDIFRDLIGNGLWIYIDDILVYADSIDEVTRLVREVLYRLRAHSLYLNAKKCEFLTEETGFLGRVISQNLIKTDPKKVEAIKNFPLLRNLKEL